MAFLEKKDEKRIQIVSILEKDGQTTWNGGIFRKGMLKCGNGGILRKKCENTKNGKNIYFRSEC